MIPKGCETNRGIPREGAEMAKYFDFDLSGYARLSVDDIWPDGDAPEDPTVADVEELIKKCGGKYRVIRDWDLDDDLDLTVTAVVPRVKP
jgi:hypothetical protein